MNIKIPVGIDEFVKIREDGWHYLDKTRLIKTLLQQPVEAYLITRPRRFGKTLTMSMLADFFDISRDSRMHFAGLEISKEPALCEKWMNQWPVIFISLKSVEGSSFQKAYEMLVHLISDICIRYHFLGESDRVNDADKVVFTKLRYQEANEANLKSSLLTLTRMLHAHYGKQVILLIDEYDVPLSKAQDNGYYTEMLDVIRAMLGLALKTNPHLKFSVVTGCLRISKESIFTGLNNLVTDSIMGGSFDEYIGFTQEEVAQLLADTGLSSHAEEAKRWYDGYRFGTTEVFCPWDVLNYVKDLLSNPNARPGNYWGNTSSNSVIRNFIDRKDLRDKENINADIEKLIAGETIYKIIREDLTYDTLHTSTQNIWSLLLLTGYLTVAPPAGIPDIAQETAGETAIKKEENGLLYAENTQRCADTAYSEEEQAVPLRIPNEEVRAIFRITVQEWFRDKVKSDGRTALFDALWSMDEEQSSKILSAMLYDTISYYDYKEDFYRAFMVGILSYAGYEVVTNKEMGEGRPDIVMTDERNDRAMVLELKWTQEKAAMPALCDAALAQIEDRRYSEGLKTEYDEVIHCGICFFKKRCMVKFEA